jgi:DNA-3-methyladenine glycosylase II
VCQLVKLEQRLVELSTPFDLDATVDSWIFPDIQPTPEIKTPGYFTRCISIDGEEVPFRVIQQRKGMRPKLLVEWPTTWSGKGDRLVDRVSWLLGWDIDTGSVLAAIRADPIIAHLAEPLDGLRPFTQPTLYEALVKAILQQQVSYRFSCQMIRNLVLAYGTKCQLGDSVVWGFPVAKRLAELSERELRACKIGYKAVYLRNLVSKISDSELDLDLLVQKKPEVAIQELGALLGVGLWTAELTVLSGLRQLDIFPYGDLVIRNLISGLYLGGKPANRKQVKEVAERWGIEAPRVLYFLMGAQVLGLI